MRSKDLENAIRPLVSALGYEYWGLELKGQGHRTLLRIYIDADDGVTVDDCARVSGQLSSALDVEDPFAGAYTLEVSSPGWDRTLFSLHQCERYTGRKVKLRLRLPFEKRRNFTGLLAGVEDGDLIVRTTEDEELVLPFTAIEKINLVGSDCARN